MATIQKSEVANLAKEMSWWRTPSRLVFVLALPGSLFVMLGSFLPLILGNLPALVAVRWLGLVALAIFGLRRKSLTYWIFLFMVLGGEIGLDRPQIALHLRVLSDIFLRLIQVIVAPLILGSLITSIASHGDLRRLGRIGIKSLVYFEVVTTLGLLIGAAAIPITRTETRIESLQNPITQPMPTSAMPALGEFLEGIFPENLAKSIADNQILQIVVFAILFGVALAYVPLVNRTPVLQFCDSLSRTMFSFTNLIMYFAPFAVAGAMAYTVGHLGGTALLPLGKFILLSYGAFFAFVVLVLFPIILWARLPLRAFLSALAEPASIAFATSTSEAALPSAMEKMESLGVPQQIVAFVIPAGYSFNLAGSTIYLALASIFVERAGGTRLHWEQELLMVLTLILTSKGVAGVPRSVFLVLMTTAADFHLSTEPILMILGIDLVVDMPRTVVNVVGNCLASIVIAKWEGIFGEGTPPANS